jgi:hypothetical protein
VPERRARPERLRQDDHPRAGGPALGGTVLTRSRALLVAAALVILAVGLISAG